MNDIDFDDLERRLESFSQRQGELSPIDAERELAGILSELFRGDGYKMTHTGGIGDQGIDYLAESPNGEKVVVQYKHYRTDRPIGLSEVHSTLGAAAVGGFKRAILLANTHFSKAAMDVLERDLPVEFQLMNLDSLRSWTKRIAVARKENLSLVGQAISALSSELARLIAKNPRSLDEIEWRDMERVLAEVFKRFGFEVELTRPAKDGGKDVVLRCIVAGQKKKFLVEVKHWRSEQKVGGKLLKNFVNVVASEEADRGLFLSTYGFASNAFEAITEIEKQKLAFGQESKVVSLCKLFVRIESGLWSPPNSLPEIIFEDPLLA